MKNANKTPTNFGLEKKNRVLQNQITIKKASNSKFKLEANGSAQKSNNLNINSLQTQTHTKYSENTHTEEDRLTTDR